MVDKYYDCVFTIVTKPNMFKDNYQKQAAHLLGWINHFPLFLLLTTHSDPYAREILEAQQEAHAYIASIATRTRRPHHTAPASPPRRRAAVAREPDHGAPGVWPEGGPPVRGVGVRASTSVDDCGVMPNSYSWRKGEGEGEGTVGGRQGGIAGPARPSKSMGYTPNDHLGPDWSLCGAGGGSGSDLHAEGLRFIAGGSGQPDMMFKKPLQMQRRGPSRK